MGRAAANRRIAAAKAKAAKEWCLDHGYEFKVLTENELGIR